MGGSKGGRSPALVVGGGASLLEVLSDSEPRSRSPPASRAGWPSTGGWPERRLVGRRTSVLSGLHLGVDQVLHPVRVADVGEALLTLLGARLDHQVAGADDALEHALVEVHAVDALERDLDAALGEHAVAEDDPVAGDDEVRRDPLEVGGEDPQGAEEDQHDDDPLDRRRGVHRQHDDPERDRHHEGEHRLREVPPVRVEVEGKRLVVVEQLLRVRHGTNGRSGARR